MCLDYTIEGKPDWKIGYKVMRQKDKHLYGEYRTEKLRRPIGKWLDEKNFQDPFSSTLEFLYTKNGIFYPKGWHVYESLKDIPILLYSYYVIRKVKCRQPLAQGYQKKSKVGIFKEIMFIKGAKICV